MKLTIQIHSAKATILAEFSKGNLKKVTLQKGKLTAEQWLKIGAILPPTESEITTFKSHLNGVATYEILQEKKSLYSQFLNAWFEFYERFVGVKPRFNATDGKVLKAIIKYFQEISQDDNEALLTWQALLTNWQRLDVFHQKNTDLKYINGSLNKIIQNAKQLTTTGTKSKYSDDFKRKIFEVIQPEQMP
ncbi:hypothetical protein [Capnocytophaga sp.]|uniref:hypothetical protein n=1 Tax=Capnocytophaga sp. TaxID=44737 RepID=UPI0026DBEBF1|nr:hypothetical protein [Capnocytophaga sp.]MDO5106236.1 hypothetical protein [Capnocytophaga sp.]